MLDLTTQKSSTIAAVIMFDAGLKHFSNTLYHKENLKSLIRYRFDKVSEMSKSDFFVRNYKCDSLFKRRSAVTAFVSAVVRRYENQPVLL